MWTEVRKGWSTVWLDNPVHWSGGTSGDGDGSDNGQGLLGWLADAAMNPCTTEYLSYIGS